MVCGRGLRPHWDKTHVAIVEEQGEREREREWKVYTLCGGLLLFYLFWETNGGRCKSIGSEGENNKEMAKGNNAERETERETERHRERNEFKISLQGQVRMVWSGTNKQSRPSFSARMGRICANSVAWKAGMNNRASLLSLQESVVSLCLCLCLSLLSCRSSGGGRGRREGGVGELLL